MLATAAASAAAADRDADNSHVICLAAASAMLSAAAHCKAPDLWPANWATQMELTMRHCCSLLRQSDDLLSSPLSKRSILRPQNGRPLMDVGQAAYYASVELAGVAVQCQATGAHKDVDPTPLLSALCSFLACPADVFSRYTLQPASSAVELSTDRAGIMFQFAATTATALVAATVLDSCRHRTAPPADRMKAICDMPGLLTHQLTLQSMLNAHLTAHCATADHSKLSEEMSLAYVECIVSLIDSIHAGGGSWYSALTEAGAAQCMLAALGTAREALRSSSMQLKAAIVFQKVCGSCCRLLQSHALDREGVPCRIMTLHTWRQSTAGMSQWLLRHTPHSLAQRCCTALAKVMRMLWINTDQLMSS